MTAGKIVERLRVQARLGIMNIPDDHDFVGWKDAADFIEQQAATITSLTAEVGTVKACLSSMRPRSDDAAYVAGFKAAVDEVRASLFEPIEALAAIQPTDTE